MVPLNPEPVRFVAHHVAHTASAYPGCPQDSCAVSVLDGRSEPACHVAGLALEGRFTAAAAQSLADSASPRPSAVLAATVFAAPAAGSHGDQPACNVFFLALGAPHGTDAKMCAHSYFEAASGARTPGGSEAARVLAHGQAATTG